MTNCPRCNTGGCKEVKRWTMTGREVYGKKSQVTLATFECPRHHKFRKVIGSVTLKPDPQDSQKWIPIEGV